MGNVLAQLLEQGCRAIQFMSSDVGLPVAIGFGIGRTGMKCGPSSVSNCQPHLAEREVRRVSLVRKSRRLLGCAGNWSEIEAGEQEQSLGCAIGDTRFPRHPHRLPETLYRQS